jgi:hypothetical protein
MFVRNVLIFNGPHGAVHQQRLREPQIMLDFYVAYWVSTMKCTDFRDVSKIGKWRFSSMKGLLGTIGVQIPGHRWGAPTVLTQKFVDFLNFLIFKLCGWYLSIIRLYLYSLLPENMNRAGRFMVDTLYITKFHTRRLPLCHELQHHQGHDACLCLSLLIITFGDVSTIWAQLPWFSCSGRYLRS